MKICFMGNAQSIHVQRLVKYFVEKGDEVHIITMQPFEIKGVHIHDVSSSISSFLYRIPIIARLFYFLHDYFEINKIKKIIKNINPDILDAHYLTDYGILAARLDFHPFVITVWGSDILIAPKKFGIEHIYLMKKALMKADMILTNGDNVIEEIKKLVEDANKIKKSSFGVDIKKFNPEQTNKQHRENLEIKTFNSPTVISIRSLEQIYNVETFINAIPFVISKVPDTKFIIVGDGSQKDYLKDLANSLNILQSIRFVGRITHDELPVYLASSDVYVSTSLSDGGIPFSTLEAMACGLASVVTDVADNKEWIKDGENGFIIPTKDPKSVADKIIYLLTNEDIRKKFGKINRKIVEEKEDYYKQMKILEELYISLI